MNIGRGRGFIIIKDSSKLVPTTLYIRKISTLKSNFGPGLEGRGAGIVIKFRVQKSLVVLGRASNLIFLFCYVRKLAVVPAL